MTAEEIYSIAEIGEDSRTQFKREIVNPEQLAQELVAFSNARGGRLLVGIDDNGTVSGLLPADIRRLNQLVSNVASQHVVPPICPLTEVIRVADGVVLVIEVPEGTGKPYCTNRGLYLTKVGADKRRMSQEELQRLFQDSSRLFADEGIVAGSSVTDLDEELFVSFLRKRYGERFPQSAVDMSLSDVLPLLGMTRDIGAMLRSLGLSDGKELTLAGLLLFGKNPQQFRPVFTVKCVSFFGNEIEGNDYRDREEYSGALPRIQKGVMEFLLRNLRKIQSADGFNSSPVLELPRAALDEVIVNALVHRDYFVSAPVRVLLFDNRLEVLSPGRLPNSLTIENIKAGISVSRNPVIHSVGQHLLPYTGLGSGVRRVLELCAAEFHNDEEGSLFGVTLPRPSGEDAFSVRESTVAYRVERSANLEQYWNRSGPVNGEIILRALRETPAVTAKELSQRLGITEDGVRYHLKNLKRTGSIRRVGSARSGYWVVSSSSES